MAKPKTDKSVAPEEKEVKGKKGEASVVVEGKVVRIYTKEEHGENYEDYANTYAKKLNGKVQ